MNKNKKAFLNEKARLIPSPAEDITGNRYPDDEDRVICRKKLRAALLEKRVHGKQLYPHEIVSQITPNSAARSGLDGDILNAQWTDIRNALLTKLNEAQQKTDIASSSSSSVNVGKLVPLIDVSGSMSGEPMEVAIALGILVSEVNHPSFRNRFITFHETPSWINLDNLNTISEKVLHTRNAPWGGSTNIESALNLILQVVVSNRLPMEDVPDLIIFSDMQFNQADRNTSSGTYLDIIKQKFSDAGVAICGTPYPMPKIIFWNLRGDTRGHAASHDSENVQLLSGYSPSLLKHVLEGDPLEIEVEEMVEVIDESGEIVTEKVTKTRKVTPYDTLRKVLDDVRYDPVRVVLSNSNEGVLSRYHFEPITAIPADAVNDIDMTA
jgi:Mg-chelatase subunit ChlD